VPPKRFERFERLERFELFMSSDGLKFTGGPDKNDSL
jgi:hypothetical protein